VGIEKHKAANGSHAEKLFRMGRVNLVRQALGRGRSVESVIFRGITWKRGREIVRIKEDEIVPEMFSSSQEFNSNQVSTPGGGWFVWGKP